MDDSQATSYKTESTVATPARVLGGLGFAALLLLAYPAISLTYTWLTQRPEHSVSGLNYRMDLAHASLGELLLIPGFGETLANRWLQERDALIAKYHDPLAAIEQMKGIGPAKLKVIRQYALASPMTAEKGDASKLNSESP